MGKLRELLQAEGARFRAERDKRKQTLSEWQELLKGLFARVRGWLKDSDPEGLLDVEDDTVTIHDPALGEYEAPVLRITLGRESVDIVPRARYGVAVIQPPNESHTRAQGLVEIKSRGWASHNLFHLPNDRWFIIDASKPMRADEPNAVEPLTAERLEAALASQLR